jgi:hypothetical protein
MIIQISISKHTLESLDFSRIQSLFMHIGLEINYNRCLLGFLKELLVLVVRKLVLHLEIVYKHD